MYVYFGVAYRRGRYTGNVHVIMYTLYYYNLRFLKQHSLYHQVVWFVGSKPPDQPDPQHRRRIG